MQLQPKHVTVKDMKPEILRLPRYIRLQERVLTREDVNLCYYPYINYHYFTKSQFPHQMIQTTIN